jgi:peptide/nickel transport system permease protein
VRVLTIHPLSVRPPGSFSQFRGKTLRIYILQRLLLAIPTLIAMSLLIFVILRILPGDTLVVMSGGQETGGMMKIDEEKRNALIANLGLDRPLYHQYVLWAGRLLQGDFGESFHRGLPIKEILRRRGPISLEIAFLAFVISWIVGLPIGVFSGSHQDTRWDYVVRVFSISLMAIPTFWLAAIIVMIWVLGFHYIPPLFYQHPWDNPWHNLQQVIGPALVLGLSSSAIIARMSRSSLLGVMQEDYIRMARGKGLGSQAIVWRHALRNAVLPVLTISGLSLGHLLGGSVVVETAFRVPGIGNTLIEAIRDRDLPVIQAIVFIYTGIFILVNLAVDLTYAFLDPRIRYRD